MPRGDLIRLIGAIDCPTPRPWLSCNCQSHYHLCTRNLTSHPNSNMSASPMPTKKEVPSKAFLYIAHFRIQMLHRQIGWVYTCVITWIRHEKLSLHSYKVSIFLNTEKLLKRSRIATNIIIISIEKILRISKYYRDGLDCQLSIAFILLTVSSFSAVIWEKLPKLPWASVILNIKMGKILFMKAQVSFED